MYSAWTWMAAAAIGAMTTGAMGQTPGATTYHLRTGSTEQKGCFGVCLCVLEPERPMRGRFVLTPTGSDMWTQFFAVSDVVWRSPLNSDVFAGTGAYEVGGDFALTQRMTANLEMNGQPVQAWDSGTRVIVQGPYYPVISVQLTLHDMACYDVVLKVRATPLAGDWNGDGALAVQDIFDFIGDWFGGDGDANEDGVQSVQDVFDFVNAWLTGA